MHKDIDELTWETLPDLFRRDVDRTGDCWLWIGPTFLPKESKKPHANYGNQSIYFYVYQLMHGNPAKGLEIHHQCHAPLCVRPSHLEVLTKEQHMARHHCGPLREFCKNGHSIDQYGEHVFPNGLKRCRECLRMGNQRRLAILNALPLEEKKKRSRKSNQYKTARMARDHEYAERKNTERKAYMAIYHRTHLSEKRAKYQALSPDKKLERSRKLYERQKKRIEKEPGYAELLRTKKLAYQRRYNAANSDRVRAQRHAAYLVRKTRHAQPPG